MEKESILEDHDIASAGKERGDGAKAPAPQRRYAGRAVGERAAERRERLLDAGFALIGAHGYAETTVQSVCASAHVAPRDFYVHFEDREALFLAVLEERIAAPHTGRMAALAPAQDADVTSHFRRRFEAMAAFYTEDLRRLRIRAVEAVGISPRVEERRQALLRRCQALMMAEFRHLAARGLVADRDWRLTAIAAVGVVEALFCAWLAGNRPGTLAELTAEAARFVAAALAPHHPQPA